MLEHGESTIVQRLGGIVLGVQEGFVGVWRDTLVIRVLLLRLRSMHDNSSLRLYFHFCLVLQMKWLMMCVIKVLTC